MDLAMVGLMLFVLIGVMAVVALGFQLLLGEPLTLLGVVVLATATLVGCRWLWSLERPAADAPDKVVNRVRGYS